VKSSVVRRVFTKAKPRPKPPSRRRIAAPDRKAIRQKTGGKCHFCGGPLGRPWQADHVVPLQRGGASKNSNYLPICVECNRLRWNYRPSVLRLALRLGLRVKQEIRHRTPLGEVLVLLATGKSSGAVSRLTDTILHQARSKATGPRRRRTKG